MAENIGIFRRYFNSTTVSGRANVGKATYASIALTYIFFKLKSGLSSPTLQTSAEAPQLHGHGSVYAGKSEAHGGDAHGGNAHGGDTHGGNAHGGGANGRGANGGKDYGVKDYEADPHGDEPHKDSHSAAGSAGFGTGTHGAHNHIEDEVVEPPAGSKCY